MAVEVGLFERLGGGSATLDELAQRTEIPRRTLRIITDAMVALGLLERSGDRYQNGAAAAAFLSGNGGPDLRAFLRLLNGLSYPRWGRLEEAVRTDRIIYSVDEAQQWLHDTGWKASSA